MPNDVPIIKCQAYSAGEYYQKVVDALHVRVYMYVYTSQYILVCVYQLANYLGHLSLS